MTRKRDRWKGICERLLRAIDSGFVSPCYILSAREARVTVPADCLAWTALGLAGDLRPALEQRRERKGPGFAMILDLGRIGTPEALLAVAIHEFCHHIAALAETSSIRATLGDSRFYSVLGEPSEETQRQGHLPPPNSDPDERRNVHGPQFLRLAVHAQFRANRLLDWRLPSPVDPQDYGFPCCLLKFRANLDGEEWQLIDAPLSVVAETPPPEKYQAFTAAISAAQTLPS